MPMKAKGPKSQASGSKYWDTDFKYQTAGNKAGKYNKKYAKQQYKTDVEKQRTAQSKEKQRRKLDDLNVKQKDLELEKFGDKMNIKFPNGEISMSKDDWDALPTKVKKGLTQNPNSQMIRAASLGLAGFALARGFNDRRMADYWSAYMIQNGGF